MNQKPLSLTEDPIPQLTWKIAISVLGIYYAPLIFQSLGAEGVYLSMTLDYMNVILGGGLFFILTMAINASLQAQGETRVYRNFLIGGFLMNCALNPLLMWGFWKIPALGVSGIALATVIVQIAGTGLLWRESQKRRLGGELSWSLFKPDYLVIKQILRQSIPSALNMMTIALGVFVITWFIQKEGKEVVAASGIATRIEQIVLLPVIGLSSAVLSIVGQNHGAGLRARVCEAWLFNLKRGAVLMVLGGFLVALFGEYGMHSLLPMRW